MFRLKKNILLHRTKDRVLLFDSKKYLLFSLNSVAGDMLEALLKHSSKESVILSIMKKYEASNKTIEKDLNNFIDNLRKNGVLKEKIKKK